MNDSAFLAMFLIVTAVMAVFPFLFKRFGVPAVISLLVVGMLIGDTGIGVNLIPRLATATSFLGSPGLSPDPAVAGSAETIFTDFIDKLGLLGLMFLMSLAGMEADFRLIKSCRRPVLWLSTLTFALPAAGGFLLYRHFNPGELSGQILYASLFASHSVGIVFPVIRGLGLSRSRFGASVLIATVVTDIASIILLAVSVQLFRQNTGAAHTVLSSTLSILDHGAPLLGNGFMPVFLGVVVLFLAAMVFIVNRIGRWFVGHASPGEDMMVTIMLLVIVATAFAGELLGINFIIGSFIAGLGLSRVVRAHGMLLFRKFENIGYGFLIPFLFVSIGMKTDFRVFLQPHSVSITALTVVVLVGTKFLSGLAAMTISGFSARAGVAAGLMTVPQLSATLTAAAIGRTLGIIDGTFFNAIIILSLVTTLPVPSLVLHVIRNCKDPQLRPVDEDFGTPRVVREDELL